MSEKPNMIKKGKNAGITVYPLGLSKVPWHFGWPSILLLCISECAIVKVYGRKKKKKILAEYILIWQYQMSCRNYPLPSDTKYSGVKFVLTPSSELLLQDWLFCLLLAGKYPKNVLSLNLKNMPLYLTTSWLKFNSTYITPTVV